MKLLVYGWNFDKCSGRCYDLPIDNESTKLKINLCMNQNGIFLLRESSQQQQSQLNKNNLDDFSVVPTKTELISIQRDASNNVNNTILHNTAMSIIEQQKTTHRNFQCMSMSDNISAYSMDNNIFILDDENSNDTNTNITKTSNIILQDRKLVCRSLHVKHVIRKVSCGCNHCLVMTKDCCYSYGSSLYGVLGLGSNLDVYIYDLQPILLPTQDQTPIDIAAGPYHSAIVTYKGNVYTFGNGAYYRLGHGNTDNCNLPTKVQHDNLKGLGQYQSDGSSTGLSHVSCGLCHTIVLADTTSEVYGWGWNQYGQIGPCLEEEEDESGEATSRCSHSNEWEATQIKEMSKVGDKRKELYPIDNHINQSNNSNRLPHREEIITTPRCITHLLSPFLLATDNFCSLDHSNQALSTPITTTVDDILIQSIQCGVYHTTVLLSTGQIIIMGQIGICLSNITTNNNLKRIDSKIYQFISNSMKSTTNLDDLSLNNTIISTTTIPSNQSYLMINTYLHTSSILENSIINNNMYVVHMNNNPMIACYDHSLCILIT